MGNKFKVGDRVRVYHGSNTYRGTITEFANYGTVVVSLRYGGNVTVHKNQLRRLIRRKKCLHPTDTVDWDGDLHRGLLGHCQQCKCTVRWVGWSSTRTSKKGKSNE